MGNVNKYKVGDRVKVVSNCEIESIQNKEGIIIESDSCRVYPIRVDFNGWNTLMRLDEVKSIEYQLFLF